MCSMSPFLDLYKQSSIRFLIPICSLFVFPLAFPDLESSAKTELERLCKIKNKILNGTREKNLAMLIQVIQKNDSPQTRNTHEMKDDNINICVIKKQTTRHSRRR